MTAKLSKEVTDRMKAGLYVLSAFEIEGPRVSASFADAARPNLDEGDDEPRPYAFVVALARQLRAALDHLVEADSGLSEAVALESLLRKQQRSDKRELAFTIVALRQVTSGQYVRPDLDNLALQPLEARDTVTVLRRARLISERFEAENLSALLGEARFEEGVDVKAHVKQIHGKASDLLALADKVNEAHRATCRARGKRNDAREDYDRTFLRCARMFEDLCRLTGHDEQLAARVRKTTSRPGRGDDGEGPEESQQEPRNNEPSHLEANHPEAGPPEPGSPADFDATAQAPPGERRLSPGFEPLSADNDFLSSLQYAACSGGGT